jgi:hypothetical protein
MVTKALVIVAIAALAAGGAAMAAPTGSVTTAPVIIITVRVNVTDTAFTMTRYRARRGWGAHFVVTNAGKKPHRLDIGGLLTPVIAPGKRARVSAGLEERGRYAVKITVNNGGPKHSGWFTVY